MLKHNFELWDLHCLSEWQSRGEIKGCFRPALRKALEQPGGPCRKKLEFRSIIVSFLKLPCVCLAYSQPVQKLSRLSALARNKDLNTLQPFVRNKVFILLPLKLSSDWAEACSCGGDLSGLQRVLWKATGKCWDGYCLLPIPGELFSNKTEPENSQWQKEVWITLMFP